jgi:hypothetical protein
MKPVVKTRRSLVKPSISPSSELVVSSESEVEDGYGKEIEDEADAKCLYCAGLFCEDHNGEARVRCQNCIKWAHCLCELSENVLCVWLV